MNAIPLSVCGHLIKFEHLPYRILSTRLLLLMTCWASLMERWCQKCTYRIQCSILCLQTWSSSTSPTRESNTVMHGFQYTKFFNVRRRGGKWSGGYIYLNLAPCLAFHATSLIQGLIRGGGGGRLALLSKNSILFWQWWIWISFFIPKTRYSEIAMSQCAFITRLPSQACPPSFKLSWISPCSDMWWS